MFEAERVSPCYRLHPYQRQVLDDIISTLSSPERRAVAHLPTGAGKTRIACHVACQLLNQTDIDDTLVVWLASTEELCEQAAEELARAWGYLGRRKINVHRFWGESSLDLRRLSSGFLIAGLSKLRYVAFQDHTILAHLAGCISGVIFDEAHQAIAPTYSFLAEQLTTRRPPLLGLTATPGRTSGFTENDFELAEMFAYKKVSIDPKGHENPVTFLINNRYLAEPRFIQVTFEADSPSIEPVTGSDYSTDALRSLGNNIDRIHKIVDLSQEAAARHPRTIVFCPSVEAAVECARLLQARKIKAGVITANTPPEERRETLDDFRSDSATHMVLFNYGVLTTGFDAPRTRCAIIGRPTTSLVLYSQMVGRAMRGPRTGGNRRAEIYTVADTNLPGFGSVASAFSNWEELWSNNPPN